MHKNLPIINVIKKDRTFIINKQAPAQHSKQHDTEEYSFK